MKKLVEKDQPDLSKTFASLWTEDREDDVEGYAVDLFKAMHKHKLPPEVIDKLTLLLAELNSNLEYIHENHVEKDDLTKFHDQKFLKHRHDGKEVLLPAEEMDC